MAAVHGAHGEEGYLPLHQINIPSGSSFAKTGRHENNTLSANPIGNLLLSTLAFV